jgi:hypothetical protein
MFETFLDILFIVHAKKLEYLNLWFFYGEFSKMKGLKILFSKIEGFFILFSKIEGILDFIFKNRRNFQILIFKNRRIADIFQK